MNKENILHLTLKKKWFDMIASGEKKEEYRELKKFWFKRFFHYGDTAKHLFRQYDLIKFTNGYAKNAPSMLVECLGIEIRMGKLEWGAPEYANAFVLKLGKIINKDEPQQPIKSVDYDAEMTTWFAIAYNALEELIILKDAKEGKNSTVYTESRKQKAWYAARQVIELWQKSDYGAMPIEPIKNVEQ